MLVDNVTLKIQAGSGGRGAATFRSDSQNYRGGPDGGTGGNGGTMYVKGSHNLTDLREFRYKKSIVGENGTPGRRQNMHGKNAPDLTIEVPLGTRITDTVTHDIIEISDTDSVHLLAKGGRGGRGNLTFKTSTNQAPREFEPGEPGQEKVLLLELTLIAEIGLIGQPNAGKSSLLTVLTNATPKIGAYPFTTLEPTIGMLDTHPIADVPGLIEGASRGVGLGTAFLRHINKTKILFHVIDITHPDPMGAYKEIRKEFELFDPELLEKPEYIVLNKTDLADAALIKRVSGLFTKKKLQVIPCSIYDPASIDALKDVMRALLK